MSGGWTPNVNLWSHCGGKLLWDDECGFYKPDPENTPMGREGETNMLALGACAGVFSNYDIQDQVPRKINQLASRLKIKSKRYIETNVFSKEPEKRQNQFLYYLMEHQKINKKGCLLIFKMM